MLLRAAFSVFVYRAISHTDCTAWQCRDLAVFSSVLDSVLVGARVEQRMGWRTSRMTCSQRCCAPHPTGW